jgi:uncharacterized membrane protein YfcA
MNPLVFLGASFIGLSLGLTGAGGSIITLPVLVYLAGVAPKEAVGMSLFVVGSAAAVGALHRIRSGEFHFKAAILFILAGMLGAAGGAKLTHLISGHVLMFIFALLMLVIAGNTLLRGDKHEPANPDAFKISSCFGAGLGVGILTGFIGVGGGFLLMPALVKFARLPTRIATGTSLVVISFNSASGFLAHFNDAPPRWNLALLFAALAAVGVSVGTAFAAKLSVVRLGQIFAFMVLTTGCYVLWQSLR